MENNEEKKQPTKTEGFIQQPHAKRRFIGCMMMCFQARPAIGFAGSILRHISFLTVSFWKSSALMHRHHRRFGSLKRQRGENS
jgi:hypothetical protein